MPFFDFLQKLRDDIDLIYPRMNGKGDIQNLIGSAAASGNLNLQGSSHATLKGTVDVGPATFDADNSRVEVPTLYVANRIRLLNGTDPDLVGIEVESIDTTPIGTVYAGKLLVKAISTNTIYESPLYERAGVLPPQTIIKDFRFPYNITAPASGPADTFLGANATTINARVASSGNIWTEYDSAHFGIRANRAYSFDRLRNLNVATLGGQAATGTVKVKMFKVGGNFARFCGIIVHFVRVASNNYTGYLIHPGSDFTTLRLDYWNGTTYRNDADTAGGPIATGGTLADGNELQVELGSNTIRVLINGTQVIAAQTITKNLSSVAHGLFIEQGSAPDATHDTDFDDFVGAQ